MPKKTTAASVALVKTVDHIGLFFAGYGQFNYDATSEVWTEYRRMVQHFGWQPKGRRENTANNRFRAALVQQFGQLYGTDESKLETLQRLCEKLELYPVPASVTACKKAIKKVHVNIIDFIDSERTGEPVHKFRSVRQLAQYTQDNDKFFPKKQAKKNNLLRFLLRGLLG
ncbi:hypothetical protein ED733_002233 [Metarhizium rileyi]|uniref:Transcription factor Zn, C2H2 n=1 Tax=Metarhizium rileyi (strain RCEF 4871) TaxID=1649241 RepID=A0A5C6G0P5_METRR|nr:hypothetical protein ED733_002233 [Metarhizium rileyi]